MADRYDDALRDLVQVSPPEQWDEVVRRAEEAESGTGEPAAGTGPGGQDGRDLYRVIPLLPPRDRRSRPQRRTLVAAAAALVLVLAAGGAAYLIRADGSSQTTTIDDPDPSPPLPTVPDEGPRPTTETTVPAPPTTAEPDQEEAGPVDPGPEPEPGTEPPGTDEPDVPPPDTATDPSSPDETVGCAGLRFSAPGAPADVSSVQQAPVSGDQRLHEAARPNLVGMFDSDAGDRVVFVVDTHGFGEDGGRRFDHADLGEIWMAHNGEPAGSDDAQGIVEVGIELGEETCPVTFWSVGLSDGELEAFARSLSLL